MKSFERYFVCTILFSLFLIEPLFCADWPLDMTVSKSSAAKAPSPTIRYNFAENREGYFVQGFVFSSPESDVKAFSQGKIIYKNDTSSLYYEDFPSALGSSLIVAHPDKMISVYSNLSELKDSAFEDGKVETGSVIAKVSPDFEGLGGFHAKNETLEFQVIDLLQKSAVNPRLVMPHEGREQPLEVGKISAVSKNGTVYPVWNQMVLPSGQYYFYRTRQKSAVPYKTSFFVNGALVERIIYDRLKQHEMKLCVAGNSFYSSEQVYPSADLQLLSKVMLSSGKNIITVSLNDILGAEKTSEFVIYVK